MDRSRCGLLRRWWRSFYDTFFKPLITSKYPPWYDARAVALGLVVGLAFPVGGQTVLLAVLRLFIRFSFVVGWAFSLVSNPLNMIPLYYGYYLLGSLILGKRATMGFDVFSKHLSPIMERAYFWEALADFSQLGYEILLRWCVAAVVLAAIFGPIGYFVTLKVQTARCRRAAERMGVEYDNILHEMEQNIASDRAHIRNKSA
ncbi:MAG: DUF2062 domain-containing protein [Desulfomonile sp.]|nr:DUF2062 domain-containing protein [Desulfomonile sp.]